MRGGGGRIKTVAGLANLTLGKDMKCDVMTTNITNRIEFQLFDMFILFPVPCVDYLSSSLTSWQ